MRTNRDMWYEIVSSEPNTADDIRVKGTDIVTTRAVLKSKIEENETCMKNNQPTDLISQINAYR